jgi:glycine oxidase
VTNSQSNSFDVAVVGGGVIGLVVAWRAAQRGLRTVVLERGEPGSGASRVAAGMLAPTGEAAFGEDDLTALNVASARRYPAFVEELREASGHAVSILECGTLMVARDRDEAEWLGRELAYRAEIGLPATRLRPTPARRLEPALAPTLRLAAELPDDHAIDPRALTAALAAAARNAGVEVRRAEARAVRLEHDRVIGVDDVDAERVVVAAGCRSGELVPVGARVPVRPVKGQILRLRDPAGPGLLARVIRMETGYLVPRGDGRYVLGATVEERGFDPHVTAGAVFELLRDAIELVPGVAELAIEETSVGYRPGTPDNRPILGPGAIEGLHWATGHYRHGVLLAPITADIVAGALAGEPVPEAFAAARFGEVHA